MVFHLQIFLMSLVNPQNILGIVFLGTVSLVEVFCHGLSREKSHHCRFKSNFHLQSGGRRTEPVVIVKAYYKVITSVLLN